MHVPRRVPGPTKATLLALLALLVTPLAVVGGRVALPVAASAAGAERPNVVLITTDDQTLAEMRWLPETRKLLGRKGVTFSNALSPHPLCCPARAEILTGQFAQNNGVRSNRGRYGGYARLKARHTLPVWLQAAGYKTAFVGKFMNGYGAGFGTPEVPGWDIWNPSIKGVYSMYRYRMFNEGKPRLYRDLYNADLVASKTSEYIRRLSKSSDQPFFIWSSQVAPHASCSPKDETGKGCWGPPVPPKRYATSFSDVEPPSLRGPAFNEADTSDKPAYLREAAPLNADGIRHLFRQRVRSLAAVDDATVRVVNALERTGELDNTVLMFASDNGYVLGEHRYKGKNLPYEESLRVPLLVRGPGFPTGVTRSQSVTIVDLAPTIIDIARANRFVTRPPDGRSFLPIITANRAGHDTVLIQAGPETAQEEHEGWKYRGVRTNRYVYVRYSADGFEELYDLKRDPHQLDNVAADPRYRATRKELVRRLRVLEACRGAQCSKRFGPVPAPTPGPPPVVVPEEPPGGEPEPPVDEPPVVDPQLPGTEPEPPPVDPEPPVTDPEEPATDPEGPVAPAPDEPATEPEEPEVADPGQPDVTA